MGEWNRISDLALGNKRVTTSLSKSSLKIVHLAGHVKNGSFRTVAEKSITCHRLCGIFDSWLLEKY